MKNKGSFVSRNSILCEYKKLYSYDENFLTDEIMKQVISRVGKIPPEEVPQNGDPIGLKGPCGGQIGWAGLVVYKEVRDYLEDIKDFL